MPGHDMTSPSDRLSRYSLRRWFGLLLLCCGLLANVSHGAATPAYWLTAELVGPEHQLVLANNDLRLRLAPDTQVAGRDADEDEVPDWSVLVPFHHVESSLLRSIRLSVSMRHLPARFAALALPPVRAPPQP